MNLVLRSPHVSPWPQKLTEVQARLTTADNQELPIYLSTPEAPAVAQFRQFWIGIVPRSPLQEGVTYTVRLSGKLEWFRMGKSLVIHHPGR